MAVPCTQANFTGPVRRYTSSEGFERGFCSVCGSALFFHPVGSDIHGIPIGLFDDQSDLPFKVEFFVDQKPDYYTFSNETRGMTGAEFAQKFRNG